MLTAAWLLGVHCFLAVALGAQRIGPQGLYLIRKLSDHLLKARSFRRGDPLYPESVRVDTHVFQNELYGLRPSLCLVITIQVMTFAQVSAHHDDAVSAFFQSLNHQVGMDHS